MLIKEAAKDMVIINNRPYNVGINDGDETQFNPTDLDDLEDLWETFCKEEGCAIDSVDYVEQGHEE